MNITVFWNVTPFCPDDEGSTHISNIGRFLPRLQGAIIPDNSPFMLAALRTLNLIPIEILFAPSMRHTDGQGDT
jgi:hypothetical protein